MMPTLITRDSYRYNAKATELVCVECNRDDFMAIARTHHWRESVIALLVRKPFTGEFNMGCYRVKLNDIHYFNTSV